MDRRYASDYRIEYFVAADGKRRARRVYCGEAYAYLHGPDQLCRLRKRVLLCVGSIIGLLLPLFWKHTGMDRTWYVILPAASAAVPLYALGAGALRLRPSEVPFTREHRDKTDGRLRKASIALTVLMGAGCAGCWVYRAGNTLTPAEAVNMLCLHMTLPVCGYLLTQRKNAAAVPAKEQTNFGG